MKVETFDSCPCCGGEFRDADHPKAILHLVTVGVQRSILRELITHFPEFVPKERLVQSVYGYRGPDNADGTVEVFILHLRRRIAERGGQHDSSQATDGGFQCLTSCSSA